MNIKEDMNAEKPALREMRKHAIQKTTTKTVSKTDANISETVSWSYVIAIKKSVLAPESIGITSSRFYFV